MAHPVLVGDMHETFLEQVNDAIESLTFGDAERPVRGEAHKNQPRYRRLVVAYDGSEGAEAALAWAADIAAAAGSKVTLVSAYAPPRLAGPAAVGYAWYPDYAEFHATAQRRTREFAQHAEALLRGSQVDASSVVVPGHAGREIARVANEAHADLVIVGATRGGRVRRAVLGSTAQTLVERANASVLIARGPPTPSRILAATDGSHASYRAVAHAFHRASLTHSELIVQHVLDYPSVSADDSPPEGFVKAVAQRLALPAPPPRVRYVIDVGDPAARILLRAGEENVGLVVVGAHGKNILERALLGSTSRRVANESHASVLVVKEPRRHR